MPNRVNLQTFLSELIGSRNVYFDPPASVKMNYPAIRYTRKSIQKRTANDTTYRLLKPYELVVIDTHPESVILINCWLFLIARMIVITKRTIYITMYLHYIIKGGQLHV